MRLHKLCAYQNKLTQQLLYLATCAAVDEGCQTSPVAGDAIKAFDPSMDMVGREEAAPRANTAASEAAVDATAPANLASSITEQAVALATAANKTDVIVSSITSSAVSTAADTAELNKATAANGEAKAAEADISPYSVLAIQYREQQLSQQTESEPATEPASTTTPQLGK